MAPTVLADYEGVKAKWTKQIYTADAFIDEWLGPNHLGSSKALVTFHLLGVPYFKSVTKDEIVLEYQQLASHARKAAGEDWSSPECRIEGDTDGKSWMEHTFVKVDGMWKLSVIRPRIHYRPGSLEHVGRPDEEQEHTKLSQQLSHVRSFHARTFLKPLLFNLGIHWPLSSH